LSTFTGLAIMTLLVKRKSNGKKGIFSEKSIDSLATNEREIEAELRRGTADFSASPTDT
jgi:hypothetical protein